MRVKSTISRILTVFALGLLTTGEPEKAQAASVILSNTLPIILEQKEKASKSNAD